MVYACITWPASAPCLTCQVTVGEPDLQAALEQRISELCSAVERCPPAEVAQLYAVVAPAFTQPGNPAKAWPSHLGAGAAVILRAQAAAGLVWCQGRAATLGAVVGAQSLSSGLSVLELWRVANGLPRVISLVVASPAVSLSRSALASGSERSCQGEDQSEQLREGMEAALTHITRCVSERRDHIPPVVSSATLTFPYDVTITWGGQRSAFSLSSVKKALLQASPPPMIG
ncbi:hypothetical protein QJQ45_001698 [Haematococcus lacustris]|nr:hypothetical protein QJQ45_001698 [Haematococcus lacustris]